MKDVNKPLRKALFTNLLNTGQPVYYQQAPDQLTAKSYIVFSSLVANPVSQKSCDTVSVTTQIIIYTEADGYNSGDAVDEIAHNVYQAIYPQQDFKLLLDPGFKMVSTEWQSDNTNTWRLKNQIIAIDRTITLQHKIYIQ